MRRVVIESPYAGVVGPHVDYARRCLRDSLMRGEAPIASHLLHTQVLDDALPEDRARGMLAGVAWIEVADAVVLYVDLGVSKSMAAAVEIADAYKVPVERRRLLPREG